MSTYINPDNDASFGINKVGQAEKVSTTVAEIKARGSSLGYNSALLIQELFSGVYGYSIIYFNIPNTVETLYLGDNDWSPESYNVTYWSYPQWTNAPYAGRYMWWGSQIDLVTGVQFNQICTGTTIDNITVMKSSINHASTLPIVFITSFEGEIIINGQAPVSYQWKSVPAISGKMGVLTLGAIYDQYIGDGSLVANAPVDYASQLPDGAKIVSLTSGLVDTQSADILYSGDNYKLYATRGYSSLTGTYFDLSFCFQPTTGGVYTPFYVYRFNFTDSIFVNKTILGFIIDDEAQVAALNLITPHANGVDQVIDYCQPGITMSAADMANLYLWIKGSTLEEDWDTSDSIIDDEGDGGGDYHERINNPIPAPGVPYLSAYDSGFLSQYLVTKAQLKSLASFLWSSSFVENVKKFFNDPREIIMGISIFPVIPPHNESASNIKAGGIDTGVSGQKVTTQFKRYDFGYLQIEKTFSSGIFYDYSPYLTAKIYLPFCGEHDLSLNDIMGKTLHLEYTIDHVSGMCCAHLTITDPNNELPDECHYNFTGQVGVQIPLSSEDFGGFYRAMLSSGAAIGSGIATIATGGMTAPLAIGAGANAVGNVANMGKDVQFTSGGGSIAGSLGSEYPYITLVEPLVFKDGNQRHYMGYPYYSKKQLKNMSGFTKIMGIHLDGLSCTEIERSAIRDQLAKGVIIQSGDPLPAPDPNRPEGEESLILLHNLSDVDTIGKKFEKDSQGYVEYVEITSELLYNQDFAAVGLLVSEYNAGYNYAYIPSFGRVYYIDKITAESGAMVRYDLTCDASESFWNELKNCYALIEANEYQSGAKMLINNNTWFMKQNKRVVTKVFQGGDITDNKGRSCFLRGQYGKECFLITIAGDTDDPTP